MNVYVVYIISRVLCIGEKGVYNLNIKHFYTKILGKILKKEGKYKDMSN